MIEKKMLSRHVLAAALVLGAATTLVGADTGDAWVTTKAKIALLTTDGVSGTAVNVDAKEGAVTLHGKVRTPEEKAKAESVVRQIEGVKEVRNLLQVVPESAKEAVKATDETIQDAVQAVLMGDRALEGVKVASVNKGVVLLTGKAPDLGAKLRAIELAAATPGVRRVATEIQAGDR